MRDDVVISHRGAAYEIGRGKGFYGIWPTGTPRAQPAEWWPVTPAGWAAAWQRFNWLEAPGAIVPVDRPQILPIGAGTRSVIAAVLLATGTVFGIGALFPGYVGSASLASEAPELVPHLLYLAAWAVSAVLILLGGARLRAGAMVACGTSAVAFGFYVSDIGSAVSGGRVATGLVLGLIGWVACAAGSVLAAFIRPDGEPAQARGYQRGPAARLVLAGVAALGTAIAFAPAWDSFALHTASQGTQTFTEGYAFAEPGAIAAGDVLVMIALVATAILAAMRRPSRDGGLLLAGAVVPMAGQAISAIIQIGEAVSPTQFGVTPAQAQQLGLTITASLTAPFWIYCAFLAGLILVGIRMVIPGRPASQPVLPGGLPPAVGAGYPSPAGPGYAAPAGAGYPAPAVAGYAPYPGAEAPGRPAEPGVPPAAGAAPSPAGAPGTPPAAPGLPPAAPPPPGA